MFIPSTVGKGGAGAGNKLQPAVVQYESSINITNGAYDFGFNVTDSHCLMVYRFTQPVGVDPLSSNNALTEAAAGQYSPAALVGATFFTSAASTGTLPAATEWGLIGGAPRLRINATMFPTTNAYYLVAVCTNTPGGANPINIIDYQILFVKEKTVTIFQTTVAGIDTATLDIALGLAGLVTRARPRRRARFAGRTQRVHRRS